MKIGAIITSYDGHLYCLSETLSAVKKGVDLLVCGYDCHGRMPDYDDIKACDHFFVCRDFRLTRAVPPRRKQIGDIMQTRLGVEYLKDRCDIILKMDGDVMIGKPDSIRYLAENNFPIYDMVITKRADSKYYGSTIYMATTRAMFDLYSQMSTRGRHRIEELLSYGAENLSLNCNEMVFESFRKITEYYRVKPQNPAL